MCSINLKKKGSTTQHQDAPSDKWWPQCIAALIQHWLCMASTGEEKIWRSRSYFPTFYSSSSPLLFGDPAILYTVEKNNRLAMPMELQNLSGYILDIFMFLIFWSIVFSKSSQVSNPPIPLWICAAWCLFGCFFGIHPCEASSQHLCVLEGFRWFQMNLWRIVFWCFLFCLCCVYVLFPSSISISFIHYISLYYILYSFVLTRYQDFSCFSCFNFFPTQDLLMLRLPAALASSVAPRRSAKSLSPTDNPIKDPCNDIGYRTLMNHIEYRL